MEKACFLIFNDDEMIKELITLSIEHVFLKMETRTSQIQTKKRV